MRRSNISKIFLNSANVTKPVVRQRSSVSPENAPPRRETPAEQHDGLATLTLCTLPRTAPLLRPPAALIR